MNKFHIIGDIHGYADHLERLLIKLGCTKENGVFCHDEFKVIFVGDFIDRGPQVRETLELVKPMVESGAAYSVMGNHEYNALCYTAKDPDSGEYFRSHNKHHSKQFSETERQLGSDLNYYLDWFYSLPLFLEFSEFNVVHASWGQADIDLLKGFLGEGNLLDRELLIALHQDERVEAAIEVVLKGKEIVLPDGLEFSDKDGKVRREQRIKWFAGSADYQTYEELSLPVNALLRDVRIESDVLGGLSFYSERRPVFFGHYWLKDELPVVLADNAVCVDYSVAKGGKLVAYQFDPEDAQDCRFIY